MAYDGMSLFILVVLGTTVRQVLLVCLTLAADSYVCVTASFEVIRNRNIRQSLCQGSFWWRDLTMRVGGWLNLQGFGAVFFRKK